MRWAAAGANLLLGRCAKATGSASPIMRVRSARLACWRPKFSPAKITSFTVPNAVVVSGKIINLSAESADGGVNLTTSVTIGYDTPWRQVHALLELAASAPGR